jgi:DNA-binding CsgD family transcriptional regulator
MSDKMLEMKVHWTKSVVMQRELVWGTRMTEHNRKPATGENGSGGWGRSDGSAGRAAELARLASVVDTATTGVQVVQVSGDPWIGKTRLLTALTDMARHRGWTVLAGSADAGSCSPPGGIPFGALADAFDEFTVQDRGPDLTDVPDEHRQCLARIFPSLGGLRRSTAAGTEGGNAIDAIHSLLCALASPTGLLLVVDDLQFIDRGSLDLLSRLVRKPPAGRFVLALAYRRRQVDLRVLSVLAQLRENYRHVELELAPLADEDAVALLPHDLSDLRRQSLLRQGGGNPGVVRAIGSVGVLPGSPEDSLHHLPRETLTACFRDFRTLSRVGWLAARAAAVHTEPADPDLIKTIAELTETEIWHALDEVTAADVLRIDEGSHTFRFRDPLLRTAAYRSASTGWRIGAHRRAAAWLRSRSAPPVEVAHHLLGSDDIRDAPSVQVVLDAAETVLWDRPTRTASWVRATIGSAPLDSRTLARQHLLLGKSLTLAGPVQTAVAMLDVVDERHLDVPEHRADLACWRAAAARLVGQHDKAAAQLRRALRLLPAEDTYPRLLLHAELTATALERNTELDQADVTAIRDAALSGNTDTALLAYLLALLGFVDRERPWTPELRAVGQLADGLGDDEVVRRPHTLLWVGRAEVAHGRLDEARSHLQRGLDIARHRLLTGLIPPLALDLAALAARRGDAAAAAAHANDAVQAALLIESAVLMDAARDLQVQLAMGQLPDADEVGDQPVQLPESRTPAEEDADGTSMPQLDRLSERELEIAVLVSKGRTNQQIARALTLSHKTVETYLARIFKKLCVCSRTQVATLIGQRYLQAVPSLRRSAHAGHGVQ